MSDHEMKNDKEMDVGSLLNALTSIKVKDNKMQSVIPFKRTSRQQAVANQKPSNSFLSNDTRYNEERLKHRLVWDKVRRAAESLKAKKEKEIKEKKMEVDNLDSIINGLSVKLSRAHVSALSKKKSKSTIKKQARKTIGGNNDDEDDE